MNSVLPVTKLYAIYLKRYLKNLQEIKTKSLSVLIGFGMLLNTLLISGNAEASIYKGHASSNASGGYSITNGSNNSVGGVWSSYQINLNQGFDMTFEVRLGNSNGNGAEGYAFILMNRNTHNLGSGGGGLGFQGIDTSFAVEFDTRGNGSSYNDPSGNNSDHIAVRRNGNFYSGSNISGNIGISNIEDGNYHLLRFRYRPATDSFEVFLDSIRKINIVYDIINNIFHGDTLIYWGVTAAAANGNSPIAMKNFSSPLPVTMIYFKAENLDGNNVLTWATASEFNADRFEIYKSIDGIEWKLIGMVKCAGYSSSSIHYSYTDPDVTGPAYYRLKQIDFDGREELYKVVSLLSSSLSEFPQDFYTLDGKKVFNGTTEEFLRQCEPGIIYVSNSKKRYIKQ